MKRGKVWGVVGSSIPLSGLVLSISFFLSFLLTFFLPSFLLWLELVGLGLELGLGILSSVLTYVPARFYSQM